MATLPPAPRAAVVQRYYLDMSEPEMAEGGGHSPGPVEAEGIAITLERVVDSPVLPQAVVCFELPDNEHSWQPWLEDDGTIEKVVSYPSELGKGCW